MANLLIYYAHPGEKHSHVNKLMAAQAQEVEGVTFVDLYAEYPRHNINVDREQQRLLDHDVILFQFPLFWYSTPSLLKEWQDLVLEYGFAYGADGTSLAGKVMMLAVTTGGPQDAYEPDGYQNHPLTTFLTPLQQTATLCKMRYSPPFVLHGALKATADGRVDLHRDGYSRLLEALRDDVYDFDAADQQDCIFYDSLPILEEPNNAGTAS